MCAGRRSANTHPRPPAGRRLTGRSGLSTPSAWPPEERVQSFGDVSVDAATRSVTRAGLPVALTIKEFDLLLALLERHGSAVTGRQLLEEVWEHQAEVQTRTVDMHVAELRRKLEPDPAHPKFILTVWKVGYRLER